MSTAKELRVLLSDLSVETEHAIDAFIDDMNLNVVSFSITDVSDVSATIDTAYVYGFSTEQDALMFVLRFGGRLL